MILSIIASLSRAALVSSVTSRMKGVRDIHGDKNEAFASIPLTVTLYDEIKISRGQVIVRQNPAKHRFVATLVMWVMDRYRLD